MPEEGILHRAHKDFLSVEDIVKIVKASSELGFWKVRLTGGEPLLKKGIVEMVRQIKAIEGIRYIGMTTNGILLPQFSHLLKEAGLDGINISLDTLNAERFGRLTRNGKLEEVLKGIDSAINEGFTIKINMVVMNDTEDDEVQRMRDFCQMKGITLQLIGQYSLEENKIDNYAYDRPPKCGHCNRLRLMADGVLKSCLHSNEETRIDMNDIKKSILEAIRYKPLKGSVCTNRNMMEIGG